VHTFDEPLLALAQEARWTAGGDGATVDVKYDDQVYKGCEIKHARDGNPGGAYVMIQHPEEGWVPSASCWPM
jgi:hypothetical protein